MSKSAKKLNDKWTKVVQLFLQRCNARLHWGKFGLGMESADEFGCFDGAKAYPKTWCHFGCAVNELDPAGKFASESTVWRWVASRGGQPADFASCCSPDGFKYSECTCASSPAC